MRECIDGRQRLKHLTDGDNDAKTTLHTFDGFGEDDGICAHLKEGAMYIDGRGRFLQEVGNHLHNLRPDGGDVVHRDHFGFRVPRCRQDRNRRRRRGRRQIDPERAGLEGITRQRDNAAFAAAPEGRPVDNGTTLIFGGDPLGLIRGHVVGPSCLHIAAVQADDGGLTVHTDRRESVREVSAPRTQRVRHVGKRLVGHAAQPGGQCLAPLEQRGFGRSGDHDRETFSGRNHGRAIGDRWRLFEQHVRVGAAQAEGTHTGEPWAPLP